MGGAGVNRFPGTTSQFSRPGGVHYSNTGSRVGGFGGSRFGAQRGFGAGRRLSPGGTHARRLSPGRLPGGARHVGRAGGNRRVVGGAPVQSSGHTVRTEKVKSPVHAKKSWR